MLNTYHHNFNRPVSVRVSAGLIRNGCCTQRIREHSILTWKCPGSQTLEYTADYAGVETF